MIGVCAVSLALALPGVQPPLRLPAEVSDVYSLRYNPAGLGYLQGGELRLLYGRDGTGDAFLSSGAADGFAGYGGLRIVEGLRLGAAFSIDTRERFSKAENQVVLGAAYRAGSVSFGLTWERFSPFVGDAKQIVSAGLDYRPARWLALGLAIRDLAQNAARRQWDIGVAVRPFGERFVLSSRWRLTQSEPLDGETLDLTFLAGVEPLDGLTLGVAGDVDLDFTFLLSLDLEHVGIGGAAFERDGDLSMTAELVYRSKRRPPLIAPRRVAVVTLAGNLQPEPEIDILDQSIERVYYGGVPAALDTLKRSDRIDGVLARIGPLDVGWGKAAEVRRALLDLRSAGRRVDCYLSGSGDVPYFVASACETIAIAPPMELRVDGIAAEVLYFADGLEDIGVEVEVVRRGAYKNSPDQFTRSGMSPEQREALSAYLDALYETMVDGIADGRKLAREEVEAVVDLGVVTATEAIDRKLVDDLVYPDELDKHLEKLYGRPVSPVFGAGAFEPQRQRWAPPPQVAIVHVDGTITGGDSGELPLGLGRTVGAQTLVRTLERLRTDGSVVAVVLRVDSPGGDSLASDLIARAVRRLQEAKPVIASFGDVAASGGYYVAAGAGAIFAEPTTLTGSIGVYSLNVSAEELLSKLGIGSSVVKRGALADAQTFTRNMTPAERAVMEKSVEDAYRMFIDVVAKGRKMTPQEVRKLAEGRIWSGRDAEARGLVDEMGGLVDAVRRAKLEAGLEADDPVQLVDLPRTSQDLSGLIGLFTRSIDPPARAVAGLEVIFPHGLRRTLGRFALESLDGSARPKSILPFVLNVD